MATRSSLSRFAVVVLLAIRLEVVAEEPVSFQQEVLPILSEQCFACHGFDEEARQAGLRLDTLDGATGEADSGERAIVPGKPAESELILRIVAEDDDVRMPPPDTEQVLTRQQKDVLRKWIAEGAKYERHWSFEPPVATTPPEIDGTSHPIDRFVRARLNDDGIQPSSRANEAVLLRRVSLDLIGIPPSAEQVDAYLSAAEKNPAAAYSAAVDRLLASPHYGERWGRWWLDQARYADSNGYSIDAPRQIWKYRDWVIDALNDDMPFDQFTIEQLAGDLLPESTQSQKVATGFHRNTQINQEGGIDREQFRVDSVFDRVATTSTVWLGLTIGCAQCHDHKFDPIKQYDYYRLFAFFNNQDEPSIKVHDDPAAVPQLKQELQQAERLLDEFIAEHADELEAWESSLNDDEKRKKLPKDIRNILKVANDKRNAVQRRRLFAFSVGKQHKSFTSNQKRFDEINRKVNPTVSTLVMRERKTPRKSTVLIKGDFTRPSDEVTPYTPEVLHEFKPDRDYPNRLDLAHWIVSPKNPLTARVIANRIWQVYFGRGIVETENDFGTLGTPPTHPELLDWLAIELQRRNWSLKALHRLIVTSQTYQQSSSIREDLAEVDPNNYLLARQTRLRLEAELIRDVSLSVSGLLSRKFGGPPVYPPIPAGVMNRGQVNRKWTASKGEDRYRRGIYTFVYRATPPPSLNVFDAPDGFSTCTHRSRSNTPLQALTLLNDQAFVEFAEALEKRIKSEGVEKMFRECTGRKPGEEELAVLAGLDARSAARVLLNLDETVTRE